MKIQGYELATDEYVGDLDEMHSDVKLWGTTGGKFGLKPAGLIEHNGFESMLDYGCGSGGLITRVREQHPRKHIVGFDPARPATYEYADSNDQYDLLTSTDVMEHIEPHLLAEVIAFQKHKTRHMMWHKIATGPAKKLLPNGDNAHLIQEGLDFWVEQYECDEWHVTSSREDAKCVEIIVERRK